MSALLGVRVCRAGLELMPPCVHRDWDLSRINSRLDLPVRGGALLARVGKPRCKIKSIARSIGMRTMPFDLIHPAVGLQLRHLHERAVQPDLVRIDLQVR